MIRYDRAKLKELVLYIADRCFDDPMFGRTKLNKLLFYADFRAFERFGRPITGAEYQKLAYGPAPRQLLPVVRELLRERAAAEVPEAVGAQTQRRLVATRPAVTSMFDDSELALVDEVIQSARGESAFGISERSHRELGWRLAEHGETIPYGTAFWHQPDLSDITDATAYLQDLGLLADA